MTLAVLAEDAQVAIAHLVPERLDLAAVHFASGIPVLRRRRLFPSRLGLVRDVLGRNLGNYIGIELQCSWGGSRWRQRALIEHGGPCPARFVGARRAIVAVHHHRGLGTGWRVSRGPVRLGDAELVGSEIG